MNKADMIQGGLVLAGAVVLALLLSRRVAQVAGGDVILGDITAPEIKLPDGLFDWPNFNPAELVLPDFPDFGSLPGYSPASCGCSCEDKQISFDQTWLEEISAGITQAYRDDFAGLNYVVPQSIQNLIDTGGPAAYVITVGSAQQRVKNF